MRQQVELVSAWFLAEGDHLLPGGETVVALQRDPVADEVAILTDDGARRTTRRETRVVVAQRAVPAAVKRPRWRAGVFVATARRRRRRVGEVDR